MKKELVERFANLFVGGQLGYGLWDKQKGARTVHEPPSISNYEAHLNGEIGLGVVPVQENGTCRFAAIDIDVDTIDHAQLFASVSKRRLPLVVCRSKSGGAHLYAFMAQGYPAAVVMDVLKKWAALLGYPRAEVFPKQNVIGSNNVGSWINLPYFAAEREYPSRYAVGPNGILSLEEFLENPVQFDPHVKVEAEPVNGTAVLELMPPCLRRLTKDGVVEGQRNVTLINVALFYQRLEPGGSEIAVRKYNQEHVYPPLPDNEVRSVIASANRGYENYTCSQEPLYGLCNQDVCGKLKFGFKYRSWDTPSAARNFVISNLRKLETDPPIYKFDIHGKEVQLSATQLLEYPKFKAAIAQKLNFIPPNKKQPQWDEELNPLLMEMVIEPAPTEATPEGQVLFYLHKFLEKRTLAQNREDILRGMPIESGEHVLFQVEDFVLYLRNNRVNRLGSELWIILHDLGAFSKKISVSNKKINVCHFPVSKTNDQLDFVPANFEKEREEM